MAAYGDDWLEEEAEGFLYGERMGSKHASNTLQ